MSNPDIDDLRNRLDDLEDQWGAGTTQTVVLLPDVDSTDWPSGVTREDITATEEHSGATDGRPLEREVILAPNFRPRQYRGGIVTMTKAEVARVYDTMPDEVRKAERELRVERGEPIPPILQR
jgi:hypothetical protein